MGQAEIMQLINNSANIYFVRQAAVIAILFVLGYFFIQMIKADTAPAWQCLLAFPAGLSAYCFVSMLLLSLGIEFELMTLLLFGGVIIIELYLMLRKQKFVFQRPEWRIFCFALLSVLILAVICTSGVLSVSVDNDSMYYYSAYPEVLVKEKAFRYEFDVFLTDVGPMAAIINTLPYMFGFGNTFGIQHFLNLNFILIFLAAAYEELSRIVPAKTAGPAAAAATVFLATSAPYLTTAKWIMAGDYFMIFFFIVMYLGYREGISAERHNDMEILLIMFTVMMSMLRVEGIVMAVFLVIGLSSLSYSSEELLKTYLLPAGLSAFLYYFCIFARLRVNPLYAFLRPLKAVLMLAMLAAAALYLIFIRGKHFRKLLAHMEYAIPAALAAANALMLIVGKRRYLNNLYTFFMNMRLKNGWGYFAYMVFAVLLVIIVMSILKKSFHMGFFDMMLTGFVLVTLGVSWARGNDLRIGVGDSGNRVMLTVVPTAVFAIAVKLAGLFGTVTAADK